MTDYTELLELLRYCSSKSGCIGCKLSEAYDCTADLTRDAADAIEALQAEVQKRGEMVEVVRCKDCKHRPTGTGVNHDVEFPDAICPCQCYDDYWYSWMPSDDWYCADGEKMEVQE